MPDWLKALAGGTIAGGAVLAVCVLTKIKKYEARVKSVQAAIESGHAATTIDAALMGTQIRAIELEIKNKVEAAIAASAAQTAEQYMSNVYGLTPARITAIGDLARRLGA